MDRVFDFTQAYSQAPWRKQLQWIGVFLIVLVVILLAASVFVSVTARTAALGKEIHRHRNEIEALEYENANMQSQLAILTSASEMKQRAIDMGFRQATSEEIIYITVPGYTGRDQVKSAESTQPTFVAKPVISPAFTQSWVDWLAQQFRAPLIPMADIEP
jgi:cell division protein FtsL